MFVSSLMHPFLAFDSVCARMVGSGGGAVEWDFARFISRVPESRELCQRHSVMGGDEGAELLRQWWAQCRDSNVCTHTSLLQEITRLLRTSKLEDADCSQATAEAKADGISEEDWHREAWRLKLRVEDELRKAGRRGLQAENSETLVQGDKISSEEGKNGVVEKDTAPPQRQGGCRRKGRGGRPADPDLDVYENKSIMLGVTGGKRGASEREDADENVAATETRETPGESEAQERGSGHQDGRPPRRRSKKKRSRQKNLRKDRRPAHLRPGGSAYGGGKLTASPAS